MLRLLDLVRAHRRQRPDLKEGAPIDLGDLTDDERPRALAAYEAIMTLSLDDQRRLMDELESMLAAESSSNHG